MITTEYRVNSAHAHEFLEALTALADARRRDGAYAWSVFRDAAEPDLFLEYFLEDSWAEHLRHHERVTEDDRALQERVYAFHTGKSAPRVRHYLSPYVAQSGTKNPDQGDAQ
jgi:hypothetical protein